jgi:hypothetical protein
MNDADATPITKINAMAFHACELFYSKNCDEAQRLMEQAVESLEPSKDFNFALMVIG